MSGLTASALIVEDEDDVRFTIKTLLSRLDVTIYEASSGIEAVDLAGEIDQLGVVLLDVGLPDIDGWETLDRIRAFCDVPIMVLSARDHDRSALAPPEGPDWFLSKPFSNVELLTVVAELLARGHDRIHEVRS